MRYLPLIFGALCAAAVCLFGCSDAPGRPRPGAMPVVPNEVLDFGTLYRQNCSGCHGADGKGGAAIALDNPVYLAIADDAILQRGTANGISGTSMPAFAQSAGGMLTEKQVNVIVNGIRECWSKPDALRGAEPPPYAAPAAGRFRTGGGSLFHLLFLVPWRGGPRREKSELDCRWFLPSLAYRSGTEDHCDRGAS